MATEDDKPESTFTMEKETEDEEVSFEASGIQVDKFSPEDKKQEKYLPDKSQRSTEDNFRVEYPINDIEGSYESSNNEKNTEEELRDIQKFEDEGMVHKVHSTTTFFKGDSHHTNFPAKEEYSEVSSPSAETKIDPEMLHSSVPVLDEITETKTTSDFAENVTLEGESISAHSAVPKKHNVTKERESGHSNKEQHSSSLVAESKNEIISKCMESDNIGKLEDDSGTKTEDSQNSTNFSLEMKETSNKFEISGMDNIKSSSNDKESSSCENPESIREVSDTGCVNIKQIQTKVENQNKYLEKVTEAKSSETALHKAEEGPELRCNQSTVDPEVNQTENLLAKIALEIIDDTDPLHARVPLEIAVSGEDSPSVISIQEQRPITSVEEDLNDGTSYACDTKMEDTIPEYRGTHIEEILEAQSTDDQKNIIEKVKDEKMPKQDLKSNTLETYVDYSMVHYRINKEAYINQAIEDDNLSHKEVNHDISPSNLRVEEHHGIAENAEKNTIPESTNGDGSLQEFQIIAQANEAAEEANNLELLDVKDRSTVTSNEIPKAVKPETAKDVVWEQKEVPIPKESEEIKEVNEEPAYGTNLVSQASEENTINHKAIEVADDSIDNTNSPRKKPGKEETSIEKADGDDESLGTSNIYLHEKPQERIERTSTGFSSEEIDYAKYIPGLELQNETTKPQQADKEGIINLAENAAAGKAKSNAENELQDHGTNVLVDSGDIQTVESHNVDKTAEDSSKGITSIDQHCRSVEGIVETNVVQVSSAAAVVDYLEEIHSVKLPNLEETLNIIESKNDRKNTDENIVYKTSDASFATPVKDELLQNEENKSAESDVRGGSTKEIEEYSGTEITESESKEYLSVIDDPLGGKCENSKETAMEETTEDGENFNSGNTSTDGEHLALSQSLGKDNQPNMKDDKYNEATEELSVTDHNRASEQDIPSSQELSKETKIKKEKHITKEKDESIPINNLNQKQEAIASDNSVEKIGDKSSIEDSRCGSPEQEVNQERYQEDELKPEADPRETAARISENTKHTSNTTKLKEHESMDATPSFQKQMPSAQKVVGGSSQVSIQEEVADYSHVEEGKDKSLHEETNPEVHLGIKMLSEDKVVEVPNEVSTAKETTNYCAAEEHEERKQDQLKQEEDPQVKVDEITNSADGSKKFEEPETINTTQSFQKQLQNEEKVVEWPDQVSIAEQIVHNSLVEEEKKETNVNETKKKDELKPEVVTGSTVEDTSETRNNPSYRTKIPSGDEIVKGYTQVAQEILSDGPAEEEEELNHKDITAPDQLKPEIHHGVEFKELQITGETQRFHTQMSSEVIVVERPPQFSITEDAVNYSVAEEGNEERNVTNTATFQVEWNPKVDLGTKEDEISETPTNASESAEGRELETVDATKGVNIEITSEDKVTEKPHQVSTAEEIVDHFPAKGNKKNLKDAPLDELKLEFEGLETAFTNQSLKTLMQSLDKVVDEPPQDSSAEVIKCSPREVVKAKIISNEQQLQVDPGVKVNKISESINNASDSTKVDITQISNKAKINVDMVVEGPSQVSTEETLSGEGNTTIRDALKTEADKRMVQEIPTTTNNASETTKSKESETTEATQRLNTDVAIQDKDVETPLLVSFAEETVKCNPAEERNTTVDELTPAVDPEVKLDDISEITDNTNQNTKLEAADMTDAAQSFKKQTSSEDQVDEEPCQTLTTVKTINYTPAEEGKEEGYNHNSTKEDDLKSEVCTGVIKDEVSETINRECQIAKITDAKLKFNNQMTSEDKFIIIEEPHQVSTSKEIVDYSLQKEEGSNVNDITAVDELYQKINQEVRANEISEPTQYASESTKSQEPATIDATQSFKKPMQGEDEVLEGHHQFSNPEEMVNYNPAVERKEERNVNDTTTEELKPEVIVNEISEAISNSIESTKLVETDMIDAAQSFKNQIPSKDQVDEEHGEVLTAEKTVNHIPAEEQKEEGYVTKSTKEDDLKSEIYTGVVKGEIFETINSGSQSAKMTSEDKVIIIEEPHQDSNSEEIVKYGLSGEDGRNVNDTTAIDELNQKADPETRENEVPETTHCASDSTKFQKPPIVDDPQSSKKQMQGEDKVGGGPSQSSNAEEMVDYNLAEERKEEQNVNATTTPDEVKHDPMVNEISEPEVTVNLNESTKLEELETMANEGKIVELHPQDSTSNKILNHGPSEKGNDESNVQDTTSKVELKIEGNPNLEEDETFETPGTASATTKLEEHELIDVTQSFKKQIPSQEKDVELKAAVYPEVKVDEISEITDNASQTAKLTETDISDATQSFKKQTPSEDQVYEETCQVVTAEITINYTPVEEGKEGGYASNSAKEDDQTSEVYTEETEDEIFESTNTESQSAKMTDAKQSFKIEMASEDKVIISEEPRQVSTSEEIENYSLPEEEGRNVNDTTVKFQEHETIDATQSFKRQIQKGDKVVEGPPQFSNAEEIVNPAVERKEEWNVNNATISDKLKQEMMINEISDTSNNLNESTKLEEHEETEATLSFNKQMASEEKIEVPSKDSTINKMLNHGPSEKGNDESDFKDTRSKDESQIKGNLKVEVDKISEIPSIAHETTKVEEHELMDVTQSFGKKEMPCQDKGFERRCESPIAEGIVNYSPEEEVMEGRIVKNAKTKEVSEEDKGVNSDEISKTIIKASENKKFDETEIKHATQSFEEKTPSEDKVAEGPLPISIEVEAANYSPALEEKDGTTRLEQVDEFASTKTETEARSSNAKVESPKVELPKYEKDVHGSSDQEKVFRNDSSAVTAKESTEKLREYQVLEAEQETPVFEAIRDCSKNEDFAEAQTNTSESHRDYQGSQDSPNDSQLEITCATGGLDLEKQEGKADIAGNLLLLVTSENDDGNKRDIQGQYCLTTKKKPWEDKNTIPQESGPKDDQKEEKVGGSATEVKSEPHLSTTEGMLPDHEDREAANQVDDSNMGIEQNDDLLDLTEANNNSVATYMPFESSIASRDEQMATKQEGRVGETLQLETEELEPEDASKIVAKAVNSKPQESNLKDDEKEEKVEEQEKLSSHKSMTKLHEDENEDKKIHNQYKYNSSLIMEQASAREVQSEPNLLSKRPTEGMLPNDQSKEVKNQIDTSNMEIEVKDDLIYLTDTGAIHMPLESSIALSDLEIMAKEDPRTGTNVKIADQDEEMSITQKGPTNETLQPEIEELEPEDASKDVAKAVSSIEQESSFEDDEKEEKVEDSGREIQSESHLLSKRPTEGMLPDNQRREVTNQIDNSNLEIEQKDDLVGLTDSGAIHMPFDSSIAVSDMDIVAKEDYKTGTNAKIVSQDEEMSITQKGPTDTTLQPKMEELEPEGTSKAVAKAVSSTPQESSFKDDEKEEKVEDSAREVQSEPLLCKRPTEGMLPDNETREVTNQIDNAKLEMEQKDDLVGLTDSGAIHMPFESSIAKSDIEIVAEEDHKTGTYANIECLDDEMSIMQKGPTDETLQPKMEELEPEDTSKAVAEAVSSIAQESSSKDDKKEEKVDEEQVKITKLNEEEIEDKKVHNQDEYHSSLVIEQDSAREVQSEPLLSKRPTEGMLPDNETREVTNQIDNAKLEMEQKDDLVGLTDSGAIHMPFESSIAKSDIEIVAEDHKTGTYANIECLDDEMSIMQKDPTDETLQPKMEELEPEDTSKAVAEAVSSIAQESSSKDDKKEEKVEDSAREVQSEPLLSKQPTEGMSPNNETREITNHIDNSKLETEQKDDLVGLTDSRAIHMPFESPIAEPDIEIVAKEDHKTGTYAKIASQDDEMSIMQKGPTDETLQPKMEEFEPEDTSKAVAEAVSSIAQESSSKDDKKEEKVEEEQVKITRQTRVTKLNEDDKFQDHGEYHSPPVMEQDSAREVQNELHLNKRPTEEMFMDSERREAKEEKGKSTPEEASMTSLHNLLQLSRNENSEVAGDFKIESNQTIQRDEMKDGIAYTLKSDKPNSDEEVEEDTKREAEAESAYDIPVIVETSRDADVKVTHKKSHNLLSGVGSKVKHSIAKVKKVITGKSSHPKPSSPK